jgi:Flp pilus assembly protein TadD
MKKYTSKAPHADASPFNHEAYKKGCMLFRYGNHAQARTEFEAALTFGPKDSQAWMALGNCHDALNDPASAEKCFRTALKFCAGKHQNAIEFNLANSLLDQERFREAIEVYEQIPAGTAMCVRSQQNLAVAKRSILNDAGER